MRKENIVVNQRVTLEITPKALNSLDASFLDDKIGIKVMVKRSDSPGNKDAFNAILVDLNPSPIIAIMEGYPSIALWDLKRRSLAYLWFTNLPLHRRQDLYEAWYILKFLCQEIHNPTARVLGKSMAELPNDINGEVLERYRNDILEILLSPSAPNRIRNSLWKNYTHQVKKSGEINIEIKDLNEPSSLETLLDELTILEDDAIESNIFFGTSPIIYKQASQERTF